MTGGEIVTLVLLSTGALFCIAGLGPAIHIALDYIADELGAGMAAPFCLGVALIFFAALTYLLFT